MILWGFWYSDYSQERLVGTVRLYGIYNAEPCCHIGICLFESTVWGKGLGSCVIRRVTEWAFHNLDLHTVRAGAYEENVGSQKAFQSAGYKFSHREQMRSSDGQNIASHHVYLAGRG